MAEMRAGFLRGRMLLALTAAAPTPPDVLAFVKRCFDIPVVDGSGSKL
jgi:fatty acid CoA ligase FadD9